MSSTIEIIRKIEFPKKYNKIRNLFYEYPTYCLTGFMAIVLIYALYALILVKFYTSSPINILGSIKSASILSILLACFLMIFSRSKLEKEDYTFLFLNTTIKPVQLIVGSKFFLYIFFNIVISFAFLPLLISFNLKDIEIKISYIFLSYCSLAIIFWACLSIWILTATIVKYFMNRHSNSLYAHSLLFLIITWGGVFLFKISIGYTIVFAYITIPIILPVCYLIMRGLSTRYLYDLFKQTHIGHKAKKFKSNKFYQSTYLNQTKVQILSYFRNRLLSELALLLGILVLLTLAFYYFLDDLTFMYIYSFILNIGLKEIMIITPLYFGMDYRKYKTSIYKMNITVYPYFIPRVLIALLINFLIYFLFISFNSFVLNQEFLAQFSGFIPIFFVSMISLFFGFVFKITEGNKAIILIGILIFVSLIDFVLNNYVTNSYYVNFIYLGTGILLFLIVEYLFLRKPVLR